MRAIGAKWAMPIIWHIGQGDGVHYAEIKRSLSGITDAMLSLRLRELEARGIIERRSAGSVPPSVTYSLSESGEALLPALDAIYLWSQEYCA